MITEQEEFSKSADSESYETANKYNLLINKHSITIIYCSI